MTSALVDLVAALAATMLVMLMPGAALLCALRAGRVIPLLLLPAAAVGASVLVASPVLVLVLAFHGSITTLAAGVVGITLALTVVTLLRWHPAQHAPHLSSSCVWRVLAYLPPAAVLVVLGTADAPQVRSDTYWHVALARRIAELGHLSSAKIAFEAGAPGNANYPLPTWHALIALADQVPHVDVWAATWWSTLWLGPIAMLAFGGMAAALVGDQRAGVVGAWTFTAVVVLGYGPWYFATRYLSYPGQIAIFVLLPVIVWAIVQMVGARRGERAALVWVIVLGTAMIGVLHANYVLYPALFAGGGAVLLLLGRHERVSAALMATATTVVTGSALLAVQLPWITNDDNFLRGATAPLGEPPAFIRHRDVLVGSLHSFHVEIGSLATQPWLVVGALALPLLLWWGRRYPGPWVVAGGSVAMVVFVRSPQLVQLLDRAGSITPVTRLDRVYPAAIGVVAAMLGIGWLLARAFRHGRALGIGVSTATFAVLAAGTWWVDSIRDTRRIVVTPFVEARWVGGLDPSGLPRMAVYVTTIAIVVIAIIIRMRVSTRALHAPPIASGRSLRHTLATCAIASVALGLVPATIDRASATWQPQAYSRATRRDTSFTHIEVYPAAVRSIIERFAPGSTVLASFTEARKIASLAAVHSVEESELRELDAHPPTAAQAHALLDGRDGPRPQYVVAARDDSAFSTIVEAARSCGWVDRSRGGLWILERHGHGCATTQINEPQP